MSPLENPFLISTRFTCLLSHDKKIILPLASSTSFSIFISTVFRYDCIKTFQQLQQHHIASHNQLFRHEKMGLSYSLSTKMQTPLLRGRFTVHLVVNTNGELHGSADLLIYY